MKKTRSLQSFTQEMKNGEREAVAKVMLEYKGMCEDTLLNKIDRAKYDNEEKYIYDLLDLIQSKNLNCLRKDAQRIARLLIDDLHISKWEFLKDCITGDIDR